MAKVPGFRLLHRKTAKVSGTLILLGKAVQQWENSLLPSKRARVRNHLSKTEHWQKTISGSTLAARKSNQRK